MKLVDALMKFLDRLMRWLNLSHDLDVVVRDVDKLNDEVREIRGKLLHIAEYAANDVLSK